MPKPKINVVKSPPSKIAGKKWWRWYVPARDGKTPVKFKDGVNQGIKFFYKKYGTWPMFVHPVAEKRHADMWHPCLLKGGSIAYKTETGQAPDAVGQTNRTRRRGRSPVTPN